ERASQATTEAVTRTLEPLLSREAERLDGVREALAEVGTRVNATAGRLVELTSGLEGLARAHIDSIDRSGQAVLAAFDRAVVGGGAALDAAAGTLATAARDLQSGAEMLAPRLATLTTELGGLSREVALLLAARGPDGPDLDLGAVMLGELDRLGGSVERLTALMHLAETDGGAGAATVQAGEVAEAPAGPDAEADAEAEAETAAEMEGDLEAALVDGVIPPEDSEPAVVGVPLDSAIADENVEGLFATGAADSADERDNELAAPPLQEGLQEDLTEDLPEDSDVRPRHADDEEEPA
ncbi:MAG: hypothetical protein ABIW57_04965, partial [Polyangia bacterium]